MSSELGFCNFHQKEEILCKSHIIPYGFYKKYTELKDGFISIDVKTGIERKLPKGVYDKGIMCSDADNGIGKYDEYAINFFDWETEHFLYQNTEGKYFYKIDEFDFIKLNLFLMSFIWRCHHSTQVEFKNFNIGNTYEGRIRDKLVNLDGSLVSWFRFIVLRFESEVDLIPFQSPHCVRYEGLNFVNLYILNYKIVVKLDNRIAEEVDEHFSAHPNKPLIVRKEIYSKTKDFEVFTNIVRNTPFPKARVV